MSLVRFSIAIPQLVTGEFDAAGVKDYLARAEELGFEGAWTLEQTISESPSVAPLELLAYAAACTTRLRLGVAVLVTSLHEPLQLAASVTAVDRLSHGRVDLGVGTGGRNQPFAAFGVDPAGFVARFTEGLELMKAAWSDERRITFRGRFRQVEDQPIMPKPVQRPHPPIWFGGHAPKALARAVRLGDGFIGAGSSTTATFADEVRMIKAAVDRRGKDPAAFPIAKRVYVMIDDDPGRARERVLAGLERIYGRVPGIEQVPVSGTPDQVVEGLREVAAAGAEMILLNPTGADVAEDAAQLERLAAEILPRLR